MERGATMGKVHTGTATQGDYVAYLLRIWREGKGRTPWRASLQSPHTGEQMGFATVDDLFDFLKRQIDTPERTARDLTLLEGRNPG
jgi:hypothetical protein